MKALATLCTLGLVACAPTPRVTAVVPKADDPASVFAACAWNTVPVTTANWSDVGKPLVSPRRADDIEPGRLMFLRILAACPTAEIGSTTIAVYLQDRVSDEIDALRPAMRGTDRSPVEAVRCEVLYRDADQTVIHRIVALGTSKDGEFSRSVTLSAPAPVGLDRATVTEKCQNIQADGTLADA